MTKSAGDTQLYYFIDIDLATRTIIGWGSETKDRVEVRLTPGFHRVFLSRGQFNKLIRAFKTK